MPEVARAEYLEELANLEASALGVLDLVNTALGRTLEAVEHQDIELAAIVVADDDRIDGRYLEVHQGILSLLALQSPVAGDLRRIAALLDVALAEDLVRQDAEINRLNREVFRAAVELGTDADRREWAMTMMLVARAIERIGDNAVDVGEQVAFLVTGLFREFEDASHPETRGSAAPA